MRKHIPGLTILVALLVNVSSVQGQETTERYIPVGHSPGLSNKYTYIGHIEEVDVQNQTISVRNEQETRTIRLTPQTRIWLDRSQIRQTNSTGSIADLRPGRTVEIKYEDYESKESADWIKVVVDGS